MEKWPNFFIVGASKAGTTSLYEYLSKTPGIFMSSRKEPRYFNRNLVESYLTQIHDKSEYLNLFRQVKNEKAIGEASPTYLPNPESAELIHEAVPHSRIIIMLRDPVERAYSQYLGLKNKGYTKLPFHVIIRDLKNKRKDLPEYKDILYAGLYFENVKRYLDIFGSTQVKILIFEEFIKDVRRTVKEVLEFLGVDEEPPAVIEKTFNPYSVPRGKISGYILTNQTIARFCYRIMSNSLRLKLKEKIIVKREIKPELSREDRLSLETFYRNDTKNLQILLKRKLPWGWLEKDGQ